MIRRDIRNGAASMFVVVFTTLLLSVIALGFVSIMISDANQTTNFDLSQSAYESALAGVEDAKIALLKYHECLSAGATATTGSDECMRAIRAMLGMDTDINPTEDCDIISRVLKRPNTGEETIIQSEGGSNVVDGGTMVMEQAYTCVKIAEDTNDYLGELNPNYRTKVIPIRTADVNKLDQIRLSWYHKTDDDSVVASVAGTYNRTLGTGNFSTNKYGYTDTAYNDGSNNFGALPLAPPAMQFQLIQTATSFTLAQLETNSGANSDRGTLLLRPSSRGTNVVKNALNDGLAGSADRSFNNPIDIKCNSASPAYRCVAGIVLPKPVGGARSNNTMFVHLVLPYGMPATKFMLTLYSECTPVDTSNPDRDCKLEQFVGVQARVDSTGRANDLFRRVEARIELVDIYYPFPELAADIGGDNSSGIWKNFWVTFNCWTTGGSAADHNTTHRVCPNSSAISGTPITD